MPSRIKTNSNGSYTGILENGTEVVFEGDNAEIIKYLLGENQKVRTARNKVEEELEEAKAKIEDATILSKADAERFEAYKKLGKPEEIQAALTERDTLNTEVSEARFDRKLSPVQEATGLKAAVLKKLAKTDGVDFEEKEVEVGGEKKKQWFAKFKDGDKEVEKNLDEFVDTNWKEFKPSLMAEAANDEAATVEKPQQQEQTVPIPRMGTGAKGPKKSLAAEALKKYIPKGK